VSPEPAQKGLILSSCRPVRGSDVGVEAREWREQLGFAIPVGSVPQRVFVRYEARLLVCANAVVFHIRAGVEVEARTVISGAVVQERVKVKVVEDIVRGERIRSKAHVTKVLRCVLV
jgi:hypothetical protein